MHELGPETGHDSCQIAGYGREMEVAGHVVVHRSNTSPKTKYFDATSLS